MTYTAISFYLFLSAVLLFYYVMPVSFRWIALLAGSAAFYFIACGTGWWILCLQILLTYAAGIGIGHWNRICPASLLGLKRAVFTAALALTVFPWLLVKNGNFILGIFLRSQPLFSWAVPLGISFYTLQMISYLSDIYRGKIQAQSNPLKYALFILFFPQIVQGPIPRYEDLAAQLDQGHVFDESNFSRGFQTILWGFFLKFMIADKSAVVVNEIFAHPNQYTGCYVFVAGILYSLELYTDFMACTKICTGTARLFGIRLADNFMRPYLAVSIKDFWRRWHISLSRWLKDYIYIPLGGSRKGKRQMYVNLAVTFAVSGIWHGAGFRFLVWGMLHATYQIAGNLTAGIQDNMYNLLQLPKTSAVRRALQRAGVFFWVMLAWIIFRADSLAAGMEMLKSLFTVYNPWILFNDSLLSLGLAWKEWCVLFISLGILLFAERREENGVSISDSVLHLPVYIRWFLYFAAILGIMVLGTYGFGFDAQDFIYRGF